MKRMIEEGDVVSWKSGRKTLLGKVIDIDEDSALVYVFSDGVRGVERPVSLARLTFVPPVTVSREELRKFCRFEIRYSELKKGLIYANLDIPEAYQIVPEDLKEAVLNYHQYGIGEEDFETEYFWALWDELFYGVGMETALNGPKGKAGKNIPRPNQYTVFSDAWGILHEKYYSGEEETTLDDVIREVQVWEDNKDKPLSEREFTTFQKKDFLNYWDDDRLASADAETKAAYRRVLDSLCEENDIIALKKKAYACYGYGNAAYGQDWPQSTECLLKLMELDPDPQYANTLGYMYYYGRCTDGVPEYDKAFYYFSIGAAGWYYESRYKLSDMFLHGCGVAKNPKAAASIIWELYEDQLKKIRKGDFTSNFADVALRAGNICKDGVDHLRDPNSAFFYYLQAQYAIRMRMLSEANFGDEKVAAGIEQAISEILPETDYEKPKRVIHFRRLKELLAYGLRKKHHLEMKIQKTSDTETRLTIRILPFEDELRAPQLFVTIPAAHFCGLLDKVTLTAKKIETLDTADGSDTFCFDSIEGPFFYLYGRLVAEIEADYVFTAPGNSRKKYTFVSVTFTPGGKHYHYRTDLPLKPGDQAIVETGNGESVVTVEAVFEKTEAELAMPLRRYKKILKGCIDG